MCAPLKWESGEFYINEGIYISCHAASPISSVDKSADRIMSRYSHELTIYGVLPPLKSSKNAIKGSFGIFEDMSLSSLNIDFKLKSLFYYRNKG